MFLGKEHNLKAVIDTTTMSYKVLSVEEGKPDKTVHYGAAKTLPAVKKLVKETMKGLGVQFHDETRDKANEETSDKVD
jgi:hypothetical protein